MKFGSLFAGIGGMDKGLEDAGMECSWQVEIDEFATKVLNKHWPNVPKYGDIRNVGKENLETVDLICGGFPCQPFSTAGKQRGAEDDRHLWPEMLRVITELKPAWVIGENVPGIIPIFIDQAIDDLEDQGYTCEPFVLPALAFDAPHRRDRLFILAYSDKVRRLRHKEHAEGSKGETRSQFESFSLGNTESQSIDVCNNQSKKSRTQTPQSRNPISERGRKWVIEPGVGRVVDGVPNRVDRLRGLGNAVVPAVAEWIGKQIMKVDSLNK